MPEIRFYDTALLPAIDRTCKGTQALCSFLREDCKLKGIDEIRGTANNAAIEAYHAKTIFDREFRGKEVSDPAGPEQKMLVLDTAEKMSAIRLLSRHLQQAYTLVCELRDAVYEREYSQDPELRPIGMQLETPEDFEEAKDKLAEALSRSSQERLEANARKEVILEAQSEMPEHQIMKTIDDGNFLSILADAAGILRGFQDEIVAAEKKAKLSK